MWWRDESGLARYLRQTATTMAVKEVYTNDVMQRSILDSPLLYFEPHFHVDLAIS